MLRPNVQEYAKIRVVGIGGGGSNAVDRMIESGLMGVEYMAINTDSQVLDLSAADQKLQIGAEITRGLGSGGDPELGRRAAEESRQEIMMALDNADMVFITAGMGGGTGTGASPVVAEISRELGALTVAVVTKPFAVEGKKRLRLAEEGLARLKANVDTLIVIPNDRLLDLAERQLTLQEAFAFADTILQQGVKGISEVIVVPGLINLDFADVRAVMANAGTAMMGIGESSGENRAVDAAQAAISSPLLETSISGARAVLMNVTGGPDLTLDEVHKAAKIVQEAACGGTDADLTLGTVIDEKMEGQVRITVLATGFEEAPPAAKPAEKQEAARAEETGARAAAEPEEQPKEAAKRAAFQEEPTYDEDDIDIPAFLRRR
ncbi:MAG: cell division protein FtsZ [Armatimonadetes bacterium]|nr:cell division protein FtsZ [Armatimonadota bacterium]